jgi:hypothetical protein
MNRGFVQRRLKPVVAFCSDEIHRFAIARHRAPPISGVIRLIEIGIRLGSRPPVACTSPPGRASD